MTDFSISSDSLFPASPWYIGIIWAIWMFACGAWPMRAGERCECHLAEFCTVEVVSELPSRWCMPSPTGWAVDIRSPR